MQTRLVILTAGGIIFAIVAVALLVLGAPDWKNQDQTISSFEDCVAAGYPVMETYPEQCRAAKQTFVRTTSQ